MEVSGKLAECELCQIEGTTTQAEGYCQDCEEYMCGKCFQNHIKRKLCRNHILSSLSQALKNGNDTIGRNGKCNKHIGEKIKYYCSKHDTIACGDCIVADHQGCQMEFISSLALRFEDSSEFKDIVKTIEKLEADNIESKTRLDSNRKGNKEFFDKALSEIRKFRKEINNHIDRVEREIVSEANKLSKENEDLMSVLETLASVAEQEIADVRTNLDSTIINGDKLFIRAKAYKPKIDKMKENVALIRAKNAVESFHFEQEKQLADIVKCGVKLGYLRRDTDKTPTVVQTNQQQVESVKPAMTNISQGQETSVTAYNVGLREEPRCNNLNKDKSVDTTQRIKEKSEYKGFKRFARKQTQQEKEEEHFVSIVGSIQADSDYKGISQWTRSPFRK